MDQIFMEKIKAVESEIASTDARIKETLAAIGRLTPEVEELAEAYKRARKNHALSDSIESRKAVADAQKTHTKAKNDLDDAKILVEALCERKEQLESELEQARSGKDSYEVGILSRKAQALIDTFNSSIREAHQALFKLKVVRGEVDKRHGNKQLASICPGVPSMMSLTMFHNDYHLLECASCGDYRALYDSSYDRDSVVTELLTA